MRINHNVTAMNTHRQLSINSNEQAKSTEKLSSGFRINRSADDAAGLAISEKMRGQVRGLAQAQRNTQDGISLLQTAEGSLSETHSILQRMRELAVQAGNDTLVAKDRSAIQLEFTELGKEISRIASQTQFNTMKILDGTTASVTFAIGANNGETLKVKLATVGAFTQSGLLGKQIGTIQLMVSSRTNANCGIKFIDSAIKLVSAGRARFGAVQNRLEHTLNNLGTAEENLQAAESRVRDVDMAKEMMNFTKNNILSQAATSMLAQANQLPQGVLSLLR